MKRPAWTLQEAQKLINELWVKVQVYDYHIALTGSVLNGGYSDNDLDLVLYPRGDLHSDYRQVVDLIATHVSAIQKAAIQRPDQQVQYKLVLSLLLSDKRRIELFIPNFAFAGRIDNLPLVESSSVTKK